MIGIFLRLPWYLYILFGALVFFYELSDLAAYTLWAAAIVQALGKDGWLKLVQLPGINTRRKYKPNREDQASLTRSQELLRKGKAYTRVPTLMTRHEERCYRYLQERIQEIAINAGYNGNGSLRIHSKVRVVDVVLPDATRYAEGTPSFIGLFRQISQWHFDFVICDDETQKIVIALELDDQSHQLPDRVRRDQILDSVCRDAHMPFTRLIMTRTAMTYKPVYPEHPETQMPVR